MRNIKKFASVLLAMVMALALAIPAFAANEPVDVNGGTGSITISNANAGQTYELWRVFDASVGTNTDAVVYKLLSGKTLPDNEYFVQDAQGLITATDAAKDASGGLSTGAVQWLTDNYGTLGEKITEVTPSEDGIQQITGLPLGYYYVTTTTGTAVSVDTTNLSVEIEDKNVPTDVEKEIYAVQDGSIVNPGQLDQHGKDALAQVGTTVGYEVRIPITNGAVNYKFTDTMSAGLTYDPDSLTVYLVDKDAEVAEGATAVTGYGTATEGTAPTITIVFDNDWLKTNTGKDIIIRYNATVNDNAIKTDASNPNTATIEWGNSDNKFTDTDEAKVYTAKITVIKTDDKDQPLAGAGFILKNAAGKYYTYSADNGVVWVDGEDEAQEITVSEVTVTDSEGNEKKEMQAVFPGLADGTYTLIEKTVPEGYNKVSDVTVTIEKNDVTVENLAQSQTVVNQAGAELPSTGGIGTTIFYIVGGVLLIGAVVLLITKRRASVDDE